MPPWRIAAFFDPFPDDNDDDDDNDDGGEALPDVPLPDVQENSSQDADSNADHSEPSAVQESTEDRISKIAHLTNATYTHFLVLYPEGSYMTLLLLALIMSCFAYSQEIGSWPPVPDHDHGSETSSDVQENASQDVEPSAVQENPGYDANSNGEGPSHNANSNGRGEANSNGEGEASAVVQEDPSHDANSNGGGEASEAVQEHAN